MSSVKHRLIKQADQSTGKLHSPTVLQAIDPGLITNLLAHRHPPSAAPSPPCSRPAATDLPLAGRGFPSYS